MNRNVVAVAVAIAVLVGGDLFLTLESPTQVATLAVTPAVTVSSDVYAGAINGNVPNIAYDTQRAYTMIVLPAGAETPFGKQVVNTFAADPTIRQKSTVRLHAADANFHARWGNAFPEADQGYPTVCVLQENGGQVRSVFKAPLTPSSNLGGELGRVQEVLSSICPCTPKPGPAPGPLGPLGPAQPTMPPLANTPPGTTPDGADDNKSGLILIAIVGLLFGAVAYYARD